MCTIRVNNFSYKYDPKATVAAHCRGPDGHGSLNIGNVKFNHYLLSISKGVNLQPMVIDGCVVLFNGEIYNNFQNNYSEAELIVNLYKNNGKQCFDFLNGEYAVVIYDLEANKLIFGCDHFATKPLYYSCEQGRLLISSLRSDMESSHMPKWSKCTPRKVYCYDCNNNHLEQLTSNKTFSTAQLHENYQFWENAFIEAVFQRYHNLKWDIVLPLSAGHDSGALACCLNLLGIKYHTYSFRAEENIEVLEQRLKLQKKLNTNTEFKNYFSENITPNHANNLRAIIDSKCDKFTYGSSPDPNEHKISGMDDPGTLGFAAVLNYFKEHHPETRVVASGHGVDDVMSNIQRYTFGLPNPKVFPENLDSVFPWENFYAGTNSSYLAMSESIGGAFGFEMRYPYLDLNVVQGFLSLTPNLKNQHFKAPLTYFMTKHAYPFLKGRPEDIKRGFNATAMSHNGDH